MLHVKKEDVNKALVGFNRVLKSNGIMFISVKEGSGSEIKTYSDGSKRFFAYYKMDELVGLTKQNGFWSLEQFNFKDKDGDTWLCAFARKN